MDAALCSAGDDSGAAAVQGSLAETVTGRWFKFSRRLRRNFRLCRRRGRLGRRCSRGLSSFPDDPENAKNQTAKIIPRKAATPMLIMGMLTPERAGSSEATKDGRSPAADVALAEVLSAFALMSAAPGDLPAAGKSGGNETSGDRTTEAGPQLPFAAFL